MRIKNRHDNNYSEWVGGGGEEGGKEVHELKEAWRYAGIETNENWNR